ncbi:cytidylyltransferase domain-containing protein [Terasakiella sp.]|uniref:acylneuraminate cytidylyltransferase family protein n=1 Tax=Terasakiella sp. TaxID=2034861 RepID=UPI003AA9B72D
MTNKIKRICSVCIRGGSQGVPGKNSTFIAGKPLFAHSIDQAKKSGLFEVIAVSSDDPELLSLAREWGADLVIKRPDELATNTSGKLTAIQHCVQAVEKELNCQFKTCVDLDATSPLRLPKDIIGAVWFHENLASHNDNVNVITGCPARRSPYFNQVELLPNSKVKLSKPPKKNVLRRQDAPKVFDMNASIYVWTRKSLLNAQGGVLNDQTYIYEMPEERSIDIDTPFDLKIVQHLLETNPT